MFTGIVAEVGVITAIEEGGGRRFWVASRTLGEGLALGASVSHSGVCLTIAAFAPPTPDGIVWAVDAIPETLARTKLGRLGVGARINLERALRVGDELGGHFVCGHVDGLGEVAARAAEADSLRLSIRAPQSLLPLIAVKGSITLDGVSLTVTAVDESGFGVALVPHTLKETTLGELGVGDHVNLEVDMIARYLARLSEAQAR